MVTVSRDAAGGSSLKAQSPGLSRLNAHCVQPAMPEQIVCSFSFQQSHCLFETSPQQSPDWVPQHEKGLTFSPKPDSKSETLSAEMCTVPGLPPAPLSTSERFNKAWVNLGSESHVVIGQAGRWCTRRAQGGSRSTGSTAGHPFRVASSRCQGAVTCACVVRETPLCFPAPARLLWSCQIC